MLYGFWWKALTNKLKINPSTYEVDPSRHFTRILSISSSTPFSKPPPPLAFHITAKTHSWVQKTRCSLSSIPDKSQERFSLSHLSVSTLHKESTMCFKKNDFKSTLYFLLFPVDKGRDPPAPKENSFTLLLKHSTWDAGLLKCVRNQGSDHFR